MFLTAGQAPFRISPGGDGRQAITENAVK